MVASITRPASWPKDIPTTLEGIAKEYGKRCDLEERPIITRSEKMAELCARVASVGREKSLRSCLIQGEMGVGKESLARKLYGHILNADKSRKVMLTIPGGVLASGSREMSQSQLFGHKRGAFTGAITNHDGFFKKANGGVLFLDEIADLDPAVQDQLLRTLQEGEILPLGSECPEQVSVILIAASNKDLRELRSFRSDLYYRLARPTFTIPPLRERPEDIPLLAHYFLLKFGPESQRKEPLIGFDPKVLDFFQVYAWPGNIRQLENTIWAALVDAKGPLVTLDDLREEVGQTWQLSNNPKSIPYNPRPIAPEIDFQLQHEHTTLIENISPWIHDAWAIEKFKTGFVFGPRTDEQSTPKTHRLLVPYQSMAEADKKYDRDAAITALGALLQQGYDIYRNGEPILRGRKDPRYEDLMPIRAGDLKEQVDEFEKRIIRKALAQSPAIQMAADLLGIHRNVLFAKRRSLGLITTKGSSTEEDES